jgi:PHD/YefM family antitoxin component YafN of YafNO toxin-antitoxin module
MKMLDFPTSAITKEEYNAMSEEEHAKRLTDHAALRPKPELTERTK